MIGFSHLAMAGALAACATGIGGYFHGVRVGIAQEQAAQHRADAAAAKVRAELQGQIDRSATAFQTAENTRQSSVREIYHESQKIIERPVYSAVCVDADGLGLLDRAAAIANGDGLTPATGVAAPPSSGPAR